MWPRQIPPPPNQPYRPHGLALPPAPRPWYSSHYSQFKKLWFDFFELTIWLVGVELCVRSPMDPPALVRREAVAPSTTHPNPVLDGRLEIGFPLSDDAHLHRAQRLG
uniref:Uncharacterized protein n=1 Tax=Proboscia inermis TaxID=420281 RepID=A0A7S0CFD0_9STRA|mmetsp:Transcript_4518/g.4659  ORF Transcript_4518/g.4659 Transcript_4518/m.4659 type:complete len:107 (+) Transcript_4518:1547-1867(+)